MESGLPTTMADLTIAIQNSDEPGRTMESRLPTTMTIEQPEICAAIERKIKYQACLGADQSTPSYYHRRFDPMINPDFPSIFNFPGRTDAPTVAAIGPYLRSVPTDQLIITNAKKSRIVMFLKEYQGLNTGQFLCWLLMKEAIARGCYERGSLVDIKDSEDFAEMLLLDGCLVLFAIFLLRPSACIDRSPAKMAREKKFKDEFLDISADISLNRKQLKLELLMLHNQIPFFVVEQLYKQLRESLFRAVHGRIEEIALSCFDDIHPRCNYNKEFPAEKHHLLHLFHWSRSPRGKYNVEVKDFLTNELEPHLPSATELRKSATSFVDKPSGSLLDLSFHRSMFGMCGEISIPALYLNDQSELIFRNLIAFEQRHLRCGISVTAFCICMARLLQSETDAKLLRKNKILAHTDKTDKEIVDFFKKLSGEYKDTGMPKDLLKLYKDVATHHESIPVTIMQSFLEFFPNRWTTVSIIFASIALVLTLINSLGTCNHVRH